MSEYIDAQGDYFMVGRWTKYNCKNNIQLRNGVFRVVHGKYPHKRNETYGNCYDSSKFCYQA
ncbi:4400_t:CDS:2, partial [Gigaspora rosea]